ncbi:MAG: iron permease [Verrucomicrobia bacterium]|nr:iron permease [Verrucomicrobiota bacterium]
MIWQGATAQGAPDPVANGRDPAAAMLDIAVLVFREGLECILVLAAITANMIGENRVHTRPVAAGAGIGFLATIATWFIAVGILQDLTENVSALNLQAATGLLAVLVLLVVMNWFFHKFYWGGWITLHNRKKKELLGHVDDALLSRNRLLLGLALLGFSSFYREGFEVVLFLQSYRLRLGNELVMAGSAVGLLLSGTVAVLTFVAHRRLPYRKMLVLTGIMLGGVLIVMVGEQVQEMQLAHWISTTEIKPLTDMLPAWCGTWFSVYPTVETITGQLLAAGLVIGSYFVARSHKRPVGAVAATA